MQADFKEFVYRYPYGARPLVNFLHDRYIRQLERVPLILQERIQINGEPPSADYMLQRGDLITYRHFRSDENMDLPPLRVIFEDEDILAISKPTMLPVSPSGNFYFSALAVYAKEYFGIPKLNPIHRLDLETSGVLVFGKSKNANRAIQPLFEARQVHKLYQAFVFGQPELGPIEGKLVPDKGSRIHTKQKLIFSKNPNSKTLITEVEPQGDYSLVTLEPISGKTNQIRAHLAHLGCPIVGDKKYYPDEEVYLDWYEHKEISRIIDRVKLTRQALHCRSLSFTKPINNEQITITDPMDVAAQWLQEINNRQP